MLREQDLVVRPGNWAGRQKDLPAEQECVSDWRTLLDRMAVGWQCPTMGLPSFVFQTAPQSEWLLDISASKHVCIKRIHLKPGRVFFCLS